MEEFISLGDDSTASEPPQPQDHGPTDKDIIDLDQAQADAADRAAVNLNFNATLPVPSQQQPQDTVTTTKASTVIEIIDLEEGQIAFQESSGAQDAAAADNLQPKDQAQALTANGPEPPPPSQQQPQQDDIIDLEEGQVEDMDLSDDVLVTKHGVSAETPKGSDPLVHASKTGSAFIDQSPTRGVKRARTESAEPSVRVVYNNLTRESKRKLMELMQQWSEWQARKQHALIVLFLTTVAFAIMLVLQKSTS